MSRGLMARTFTDDSDIEVKEQLIEQHEYENDVHKADREIEVIKSMVEDHRNLEKTLEAMTEVIAATESFLKEGGLNKQSAVYLNILNNYTSNILDEDNNKPAYNTEAYALPSSRETATVITLEEEKSKFKSFLSKIWDFILEMTGYMVLAIKGIFTPLGRLFKRTDKFHYACKNKKFKRIGEITEDNPLLKTKLGVKLYNATMIQDENEDLMKCSDYLEQTTDLCSKAVKGCTTFFKNTLGEGSDGVISQLTSGENEVKDSIINTFDKAGVTKTRTYLSELKFAELCSLEDDKIEPFFKKPSNASTLFGEKGLNYDAFRTPYLPGNYALGMVMYMKDLGSMVAEGGKYCEPVIKFFYNDKLKKREEGEKVANLSMIESILPMSTGDIITVLNNVLYMLSNLDTLKFELSRYNREMETLIKKMKRKERNNKDLGILSKVAVLFTSSIRNLFSSVNKEIIKLVKYCISVGTIYVDTCAALTVKVDGKAE